MLIAEKVSKKLDLKILGTQQRDEKGYKAHLRLLNHLGWPVYLCLFVFEDDWWRERRIFSRQKWCVGSWSLGLQRTLVIRLLLLGGQLIWRDSFGSGWLHSSAASSLQLLSLPRLGRYLYTWLFLDGRHTCLHQHTWLPFLIHAYLWRSWFLGWLYTFRLLIY